MLKGYFNRLDLQLYWNCASAWVFSCKFAAYFQNTYLWKHLQWAASCNMTILLYFANLKAKYVWCCYRHSVITAYHFKNKIFLENLFIVFFFSWDIPFISLTIVIRNGKSFRFLWLCLTLKLFLQIFKREVALMNCLHTGKE